MVCNTRKTNKQTKIEGSNRHHFGFFVQWRSVRGGGEEVNFTKGLLLSFSPTVIII
jgi:hypothetical protein